MMTNKHYEEFMKIAIEEAETSLKEGNKGLGRRPVKIAENREKLFLIKEVKYYE